MTGLTTADSPQFTGINLGHASDTTLTRVSAGVVAVMFVLPPAKLPLAAFAVAAIGCLVYALPLGRGKDCLKAGLQTQSSPVRSPAFRQNALIFTPFATLSTPRLKACLASLLKIICLAIWVSYKVKIYNVLKFRF